ncbi:MAG: N-acetylmuramoyl-L-alanine amidase [Chloroflexi bacterium]|nr:N-acetylmuramoyl-L-alanine amidase [Chloroflexota bacterium]
MRFRPLVALLTGLLLASPPAQTFAAAPPAAPTLPLAGKIVVVDPGHGGRDTGAVANGVREKDVTLSMGLAIKPILETRGAKVVMTRTSDVALGGSTDADLQARVNIARQSNANAFVAIHANWVRKPDYAGATTYYGPSCGFRSGASESPTDVGRSFSLAQRVQAHLSGATGEIDRGTLHDIFWVLGDPGIPSILVETGFLSNAGEAAKLADPGYQQVVVTAIADGVTEFLTSPDPTGSPAAPRDAVASCFGPPPAAEPNHEGETWVQTFMPAPLLSGADANAQQFTVLPAFRYLRVLGQQADFLYVLNPDTQGTAYVPAGKVGPSGPPPDFQPFWVENFRATTLWSGPDSSAKKFGSAKQWSKFLIVQSADPGSTRVLAIVAATRNVAWLDARDLGPSGPAF